MSDRQDPKAIVTPYAFRVAPQLLGTPLARPWRRGAAMLTDLALLGLFTATLKGGSWLAAGALVGLLWVGTRSHRGFFSNESRRKAVRWGGAALILLGFGIAAALEGGGDGGSPSRDGRTEVQVPQPDLRGVPGVPRGGEQVPASLRSRLSLKEGIQMGAQIVGFLQSGDPEAASRSLEGAVQSLQDAGVPPDTLRQVLASIASGHDLPDWKREVLRQASAGLGASDTGPAPQGPAADSLLSAWQAASRSGDTAAARTARDRLGAALASDSLSALRRRSERLQRSNAALHGERDSLAESLQEAREGPHVLGFFENLFNRLGLGIGWAGIYFTVFLAGWNGHTPGKKLFGIQVVRLNGEPLTWWTSFSRFGGYAASVSTALLGFAEIFWDANRQALHDKVAGTVVIRDRGVEAHARASARTTAGGGSPGERPPGVRPRSRREAPG